MDKAVEAFEKSDQIFPNHPPTVANLAYLLVDSDPLAASIYAKSALVTISENDELTSIADYNEPTDQKRVFIEARQIEEVETQNIEHSTYLDIDLSLIHI